MCACRARCSTPGALAVNMPASRDRTIERAEEIPGGYVPNRNLSDALKAAGGITTWADLSRVALRRAGEVSQHDVRHLLSGAPGLDPALQEGDEIVVARLAQADASQARPSGITPPGIKVFAGNMVQSQNNAPACQRPGCLAHGLRLAPVAGGGGGELRRWHRLVQRLAHGQPGAHRAHHRQDPALECAGGAAAGRRQRRDQPACCRKAMPWPATTPVSPAGAKSSRC